MFTLRNKTLKKRTSQKSLWTCPGSRISRNSRLFASNTWIGFVVPWSVTRDSFLSIDEQLGCQSLMSSAFLVSRTRMRNQRTRLRPNRRRLLLLLLCEVHFKDFFHAACSILNNNTVQYLYCTVQPYGIITLSFVLFFIKLNNVTFVFSIRTTLRCPTSTCMPFASK